MPGPCRPEPVRGALNLLGPAKVGPASRWSCRLGPSHRRAHMQNNGFSWRHLSLCSVNCLAVYYVHDGYMSYASMGRGILLKTIYLSLLALLSADIWSYRGPRWRPIRAPNRLNRASRTTAGMWQHRPSGGLTQRRLGGNCHFPDAGNGGQLWRLATGCGNNGISVHRGPGGHVYPWVLLGS